MKFELNTSEKIYFLRKRTDLKQGDFGLLALNVTGDKKLTYSQAVRKQGKIEAGLYDPSYKELEKIAEVLSDLLKTKILVSDLLENDEKAKRTYEERTVKIDMTIKKFPFILEYLNTLFYAVKKNDDVLIHGVWNHILLDLQKRYENEEIGNKKILNQMFRILIVDDDLDYLNSLMSRLENEKNYSVIPCWTGKDVLEKIKDDVKILILDIKLLKENGIEIAQKVKNKFPEVLIIFNTAYPGEYSERDIIKKINPFGYVTKENSRLLIEYVNKAYKKISIKHFNQE